MVNNPAIQHRDAQLILTALVQFCQTSGRACYGNWSPETLRDYLVFHSNQETLAWIRGAKSLMPKVQGPTSGTEANWEIIGCGVAWQCREQDLISHEKAQKAQKKHWQFFDWQPSDPTGDALFVADVEATQHAAVRPLLLALNRRFPNWHQLKIYTWRRGQLKRLPVGRLIRKEFHHGR